MGELIDTAWEAGQAAWPGFAVERDHYASHVAALDPSRFPADLYLAIACLLRDPIALDAFEREVLPAARASIEAIDRSTAFVDDAMQRLRMGLLVGEEGEPKLSKYEGRGPLRAWVGVAGARAALMLRRSQQRARESSLDDDTWTGALATISTNNPELELLKRQYATHFGEALRDAVRALEPRLRNALKLSFVDALSIDEIGAVYGVHRATAARWIQRGCDGVFEHSRKLLIERLSLTPTELDRVTALVQSQLDVSLSQLLPTSPE